MAEGLQLVASPMAPGPPWRSCSHSPPRPTFTSPPHWRSDDLLYETVAPAWVSPERLSCVGPPTLSAEPVGLPRNVERFTRATISPRKPLCPVLKVRPKSRRRAL